MITRSGPSFPLAVDQRSVDQRGEARVVKLDRDLSAAFGFGFPPGDADLRGLIGEGVLAGRLATGLRGGLDRDLGADGEAFDRAAEIVAGLSVRSSTTRGH